MTHEYMKCISNTFNSTRDISLGPEASLGYKKRLMSAFLLLKGASEQRWLLCPPQPFLGRGWDGSIGGGGENKSIELTTLLLKRASFRLEMTKFVDTPDFFLTQKWIIKTLLALPYAAARFVSATKENSSQCLVLRTTADSQVVEPVAGEWGLPLGEPLGTLQVGPGNQGAVLILKKDSRETWKFRRWTHQAATVLTGAVNWWIWRVSIHHWSHVLDVLSIARTSDKTSAKRAGETWGKSVVDPMIFQHFSRLPCGYD